jgi:hypothetical protein
MESLELYLWVLLAYCTLFLAVKFIFRWFLKDFSSEITGGRVPGEKNSAP